MSRTGLGHWRDGTMTSNTEPGRLESLEAKRADEERRGTKLEGKGLGEASRVET